ncbi:MAG: prenyltransferase [Clostridium sp.]
MKKNFFQRAYTVMEVRTGLATGFPVLSSGIYGAYLVGKLNIPLLIFMFITGFCFNLIANVANEIRAYIKREKNEDTSTNHQGSEGLVRGDATLADALIVMLALLAISTFCGMIIVFLTGSKKIFFIGVVSFFAAITYSLGPKPYIIYPIGELVSGVFVGLISSLVSAYIQTGFITFDIVLLSIISMIMTIFLMSTNNTSDIEKDRGSRTTLPHVIGFRNSIKVIIPEGIIMVICFATMFLLNKINIIVFLSGIFIFYYYGYIKWYKDYYKIEQVYKEMGKEWGTRPLILIRAFHLIISIELFIFMIFK